MAALAGILVMLAAVMLQMVAFSRLPVLSGTADLVLLVMIAWCLQKQLKSWEVWAVCLAGALMVSFVSAVPTVANVTAYLIIMLGVRWLQGRIWQASVLALFVSVSVGSIVFSGFMWLFLRVINQIPLELSESFVYVILPGMVLNLAFAFPVYLLIKDLAGWIYPSEVG